MRSDIVSELLIQDPVQFEVNVYQEAKMINRDKSFWEKRNHGENGVKLESWILL